MVEIGNTTLPGVQTTVQSSSSVGTNVGSPGNVGIVGEADLSSGTANADELHEVTTPVRARKLFGNDSPLTSEVINALSEGAYPVYAVAAEGTSVTGEDISDASSTSVSLENAMLSEDVSTVSVTVDSSDKSVLKTLKDPADQTPAEGEVYVNPVYGTVELDAAPGTSGSIDYTHYDYVSAAQTLESEAGHLVDFAGATTENSTATSELVDVSTRQEQRYNFILPVAGAEPFISDFEGASTTADTSRLQEFYPLRNDEGELAIGSILGLRASLGMTGSAMNKVLSSQTGMNVTLSQAEQEHLSEARINPIADEGSGARVTDDMTAVSDTNTDEQNWRQGISRIVTDYVTEVVNDISQGYIGDLHTQSARNSLRGEITGELKNLLDLNAITGFTITVEEVDAMTASVDVGIDTIDPLRNIVANVTAGEVSGGTGGQ